MFNAKRRLVFASSILSIIALSALSVFAGDNDWRPITPDELAMKTPKVEPDADAEAIFWEVRLDDSSDSELAYKHYVRVKIFTERGRERFSKMDIPFIKGKKVKDVAARVIKPDGTIIELKKEDIFEKDIIKANGLKIKAKSFAISGIEPGVIVEYRYKETFQGDSASGERLVFQRDIPMQKISYYVKPWPETNLGYQPYNMSDVKFVKDKGGYYVAAMENVPSFSEENYMPPEDQVKSWLFLYYTRISTSNQTINSFVRWAFFTGDVAPALKELTKPNKEVKAKAAELAGGIQSDEEKLKKFYEFTQSQIKNIVFDNSITEEQRKKIDNKNSGDTLKRGMGNSADIDLLFASLAIASGFETRVVFSGDRSEFFFNPERDSHRSFVHPACIAVKSNGKWMYFNPGSPYIPYGMLTWQEEDVNGLLIGEKDFGWEKTPLSDETKSAAKRTGKFRLSEEGTLEGDAKIEFTGHQAMKRRRNGYDDSQTKREDEFKDELKKQMSQAEISNLVIENFTDTSKPLVYSFKVKVPNYAQKTGKRLFIQPGFFEYGKEPYFSSATRKYDIYFPYPWSENDDLEIALPKGFALDNADAPGNYADPQKIGSVEISMKIDKTNNVLLYQRKFHFGKGDKILFPASTYKPLKGLFDAFHKSNSHAITLKQM